MAYDYSSENKRLELPNPYRVENLFLFICGVVMLGGGVMALLWSREALQTHALRLGIAPLVAGVVLLGGGLAFAVVAARRLRFFFGRGRPKSLAAEVPIGAVGNSERADYYKNTLRQGGLEYAEPQGALNGVLYHLAPRLITAPQVVQELAQKHFFNALAFLVTFISFIVAWGLFGTPETRPLLGIGYFIFGAIVLLKPLLDGGKARMSTASLLVLVVAAVLGPVLASLLGSSSLPSMRFSMHAQTFFLLLAALLAVALILLAVFAQIDGPPATERSCEQSTLSMNGPPGALMTELDRTLQNEWTEQIPNRRYTRLEPLTQGADGSGRFAGELFEETQPMPISGTTAPTFFGGLQGRRHRWLVALDLYGTLMVCVGVYFALSYVHGFDPTHWLKDGFNAHAPMGNSMICFIVAAFCFQSASAIWGRFNFESVLIWVELLGVWQSSRIGTGNQLSGRMQSENDIVRVESMTMRVWRARIESVVFGKDGARQITAMFGTAQEARQLSADLAAFAGRQSVFIAPHAEEDRRRLGNLQASEALLSGAATPVAPAALAGTGGQVHEALRVAAAAQGAGPRFCTACGAPAAAGAKFCAECGKPLAA